MALSPEARCTRTLAADVQTIVGKLGAIEYVPTERLRLSGKHLRKVSPKKIVKFAAALSTYEVLMPLLITPEGEIIAGEARVAAAQHLGLDSLPCLIARHLTPAQVQAYRIVDNKLAEGEWDRHALALQIEPIIELGEISIDTLGFETGEIDVLIEEYGGLDEEAPDPADEIPEREPAVSITGDRWTLGKHRLICGSTRDDAVIDQLMAGREAAMVMTDPPFNCAINGHVSGKGRHPEFYEASSEMTDAEFTEFLINYLTIAASMSKDGAVLSVFMDHRGLPKLFAAAKACGLTTLNLCVWNKGVGAMGSLYRSQCEFVLILKKGKAPHTKCRAARQIRAVPHDGLGLPGRE